MKSVYNNGVDGYLCSHNRCFCEEFEQLSITSDIVL